MPKPSNLPYYCLERPCLEYYCKGCQEVMQNMGIPHSKDTPFPCEYVSPRPPNAPAGFNVLYDPRIYKKSGDCKTCNYPNDHTRECWYVWSGIFDRMLLQCVKGRMARSSLSKGIILMPPGNVSFAGDIICLRPT